MARSKDENSELEKQESPVADRQQEEVTVTTGAKKVNITLMEDADCIIACNSYKMTKGKTYKVPSDVAAILCYAGKAYRV